MAEPVARARTFALALALVRALPAFALALVASVASAAALVPGVALHLLVESHLLS